MDTVLHSKQAKIPLDKNIQRDKKYLTSPWPHKRVRARERQDPTSTYGQEFSK